jgi:hypothetical protein
VLLLDVGLSEENFIGQGCPSGTVLAFACRYSQHMRPDIGSLQYLMFKDDETGDLMTAIDDRGLLNTRNLPGSSSFGIMCFYKECSCRWNSKS